jgi:hypothetical protein
MNIPSPLIRTRSLKLLLLALFCQLSVASLDAQWLKSAQFDDGDMALDVADALTFHKFPTYFQYLEMMQGFASAYPEICRLDTIGITDEGRLVLVLKISDHVNLEEKEAAFFYTSSMHGDEVVGYVLMLRLIDLLLQGYGYDTEITGLVNNLEIWINPLANPDGSYSRNDGTSLTLAVRGNGQSMDLNRDFPEATRAEPDDTTGREAETRSMMIFLREKRFTLSANLHSGEEVVNYPWDGHPDLIVDDDWYRFISREYADEARAVDPLYMATFENGITNGWNWYEALGTRQDYINYYLGGRELTLELSLEKLLPSADLEYHWNLNHRSLLNYMSQCLYGIRGTVTDLETNDPIKAKIFVENHDSSYSAVFSTADHGDYYRLIKEGVYDLVISAPGYYNDTIPSVEVTDYQATLLDIQLEPFGMSVPVTVNPRFRIYPNPAIHSFIVDPENTPHGEMELWIHAIDGRMVYHNILSYNGSPIELTTEQMEPGIYLVRCSCGTMSAVQRLMVIHSEKH